jgi:hypothetical protein
MSASKVLVSAVAEVSLLVYVNARVAPEAKERETATCV